MALSRFEVNVGAKGKALPHFSYVCGIGKYAEKFVEIVHTCSANLPSWAKDPSDFWSASDEHERKNGSVYREHLLSLPRELTREQNIFVVNEWIKKQLDGYTYSYAYHEKKARDGNDQPHVHLMFSERKNDGIERDREQFFKRYNAKNPEKGGVKKLNTGKKPSERQQELIELRERWGEHLKEHLINFGYEKSAELVDMRNYIERGAEAPVRHKPIWIVNAEREKIEAQRAISDAVASEKAPAPAPELAQKSEPTASANNAKIDRPAHDQRDSDFDFSMR